MKKNSKKLLVSAIALSCVLSASAVCAQTISFDKITVPRYQGYGDVGIAKISSENAYRGVVNVTSKTAEAVTFYARVVYDEDKKDFGENGTSGGVVYQLNTDIYVPYRATYGKGQKMQARCKNHNWTNKNREVTGTFNFN